MPFSLKTNLKLFTLLAVIFLAPLQSMASHIFGMDLYYSFVSGTTYRIYLATYGDCSGSAFSTLSSSAPVINIYNGNTFINSISLAIQAPTSGVEVTPVCPSVAGMTTCSGLSYTIPGVKKFVYAGNVTLSGTSAVWRFVFAGSMGGSTSAGRISALTNVSGTGSVIQLVDTLNNTSGPNSSAVYNNIPTPFFCISTPANYNPAAVDPDGHALSFALVPGIDATTGSSVSYAGSFTATNPLSVTSGTFAFNTTSGQLSFTPNISQKSIVVYNVRETSGSTLKGTSQREMCFIILSPCSNNPPTGGITSTTAGTVTSPTQLSLCNSVDSFRFNLNPTDADGDTIDMSVSGLPTGATFNITGNGTTAPQGTFRWVASTATPGTYTFYVTYQDHGCPLSSRQTVAYTITILPTPSVSVSLLSAATCRRKAAIRITPGGAYSPWFINIFNSSGSIHTFTGVTAAFTDSLLPGTYTIRIYNPVSCYKDTTIVLAAPALPSASIIITPPVCAGEYTGIITVVGSDGGTYYTYALNTGPYTTSGVFTGRPSGIDTVHILDSSGCRKDTVVTVPVTPPILENLIIVKPKCQGVASGSVTINAYGSVAPYTYALGSGTYSSTNTFGGLAAGTYTFHIKNADGCVDDTTVILRDSLYLHASVSISPVLCNGGNATVTVNGISGYPAYAYALNAGSFSSTNIFTIPAGTDTFHVTDVQSCSFDTLITINQPAVLGATFIPFNATCNGLANGRIVITPSGGTPNYNYNVDGSAYGSSATITTLATGVHTLYVRDTNGCIYTDTFHIAEPTAITVDSIYHQMPSCYLGANGIITIYTSGGTPGYTYAINSGAYGASRTFTGLTAGSYILHIKDANGCTKDTLTTLGQPSPIVPSAIVTNSLCSTLANGQVSITASGGTPGYTYAVGTGSYSSSGNFYYLPAGAYTFHIKDANGCIKDTAITITNTLHISGIFTIVNEPCPGDSTGVITVTGTGGTNPYTYAFGSGSYSTTNTYNSLSAGFYAIHVKDSNGCIGDTIVAVAQPNRILPLPIITSPSCYADSNGSIAITATGGTAPFTYALNSGAYLPTVAFVGLPAGTYTIKVKDANGCLQDTVVTISQPNPLVVDAISGTDPLCHGGGDGTVSLTAAGGTPTYSYAADGALYQPIPFLTGLSAGVHIIHVKDSHGCIFDTAITLSEPAALIFKNISITTPTCEGFKNGVVTLYAGGGISPYQYSRDNINYSTSNTFSTLAEGTYTFYTRDAHNCVTDTTLTLLGYPHIIIDTLNIANPTCAGKSDAVIAVIPTGGTAPFTYSISGKLPQFLPGIFNNLHSGVYSIFITDSNGCIKDTVVIIPEPDTMVIKAIVTPNDCYTNDNNGGAVIRVTGGNAPYTYKWSSGAGNDSAIIGLANNNYMVWVTDHNYCVDSAVVRIGYDDCCIPYIPNAFSPNNDGKNDIFRLKYKGDIRIIEFSVFNRYGERVFTTSYSEDGWDGSYKGEPADIGSYYYYVRLLCGNLHNEVQEFKGNVTLVR